MTTNRINCEAYSPHYNTVVFIVNQHYDQDERPVYKADVFGTHVLFRDNELYWIDNLSCCPVCGESLIGDGYQQPRTCPNWTNPNNITLECDGPVKYCNGTTNHED